MLNTNVNPISPPTPIQYQTESWKKPLDFKTKIPSDSFEFGRTFNMKE